MCVLKLGIYVLSIKVIRFLNLFDTTLFQKNILRTINHIFKKHIPQHIPFFFRVFLE